MSHLPLGDQAVRHVIVTYSVPFEEYDDSIVDDLCAHKWVNEAHVDGDAEDRIFAVYAHYVVPRGGKVASELPMERFPNIKIVNGDVARPGSTIDTVLQYAQDRKTEQHVSRPTQPDDEQGPRLPLRQDLLDFVHIDPLAAPTRQSQQHPQQYHEPAISPSVSDQPHSQQQSQQYQHHAEPTPFGVGMLAQDEGEQPDFEVTKVVPGKSIVKGKRIVKRETEDDVAPMQRTRSAKRPR